MSIEVIYGSIERECNMLQIIFIENIYRYSIFYRTYLKTVYL